MEPRFSRLALALLACLQIAALAAVPAAALEIGVEGRSGNLHFPWAEQAPVVGDFPATNLFWGGAAWIQAPLGPEASFRAGYETDPVLRHVAGAQVQFERGIALARSCQQALREAEQKVQLLMRGEPESGALANFNPDAAD